MTYDEIPIDAKAALDEGKKTLLKTKIKLQQQSKAFGQKKHFIDTFTSGYNKYLVQLNVRGECMKIKRSILGICNESVLAKNDSTLWKKVRNYTLSKIGTLHRLQSGRLIKKTSPENFL